MEAAVEVLLTALGGDAPANYALETGGNLQTAATVLSNYLSYLSNISTSTGNTDTNTSQVIGYAQTTASNTTDASTKLSSIQTYLLTLANNSPALGQAAKAGSVPVTLATDQGAISVAPSGGSFNNITTATTTQVKNAAGVLQSVQINTVGAGTTTIKIYDATSGTSNPICTISGLTLGNFQYNVACATGIRVITTGSVTAPDITVIYA